MSCEWEVALLGNGEKKKQSIICYQDQVDAWVNLKQYVLAYSPEKGQLEILKYSCTGFFFFLSFLFCTGV